MKASGQVSVGSVLSVAATRYRDREAITCTATGRRFSFSQVNARTNRLANALLGLGLRKGDVAAFLCTNRAEMVEIYFALAKTGIVGVPLNYRLANSELLRLLSEFGARVLLFEAQFLALAELARTSVSGLTHLVGIGQAVGPARGYEDLLAGSFEAEPRCEVHEEDEYYLNLTSGTTGLPKSYALTHYNNALTIAGFPHLMDLGGSDVVLTVFPMFGRVGFAWAGAALSVGARNVLTNFDPKHVLALVAKERVTLSNWVPTMASMVLSSGEVGKHDLSSLRSLVFAGAPFPSALFERVRTELCPNVAEYYGMQETGVLTMARPQDKARKPGTVGQVVQFAEVRVVDAEGRDLPTGERGEVIARSPGATGGYWRAPEHSAVTFRQGWVHTGDLGSLDDEGFLTLSGRIKELIITGGQNVLSVEVENLIAGMPGVSDCAVIGLPDPVWGEAVTAVVVRSAGVTLAEQDVITYCRERIAHFKAPRRVIFSDEAIPRTPTGKVTKYVLVERYGRG